MSEQEIKPSLLNEEQVKRFDRFLDLLEKQMEPVSIPSIPPYPATAMALPGGPPSFQLSPEDETTINQFMEMIDSDIKECAEDLLREEIRDRVARNPEALKKELEKKRKPKIKRKKGCIFIQWGEGTPKDPIEEMMVAST